MGATVSPHTLYDRITSGDRVNLLDLRDREAYERWRITGPTVRSARISGRRAIAASVTGSLPDLVRETGLAEPIVAVCPRGKQSAEIAATLTDAGIDAANLEDGMQGWARLLIDSPVPQASGVIQFARPSSGCLSYLLIDEDEAAIIDPLRAFTDRYLDAVADHDAELRWAIDTHVHADHVSGIRALAERSPATPVLPSGAAARGLSFDANLLEDGATLRVGSEELTGTNAPGHTPELMVYRWGDLLCTGDVLFLDGVGRPDLAAGADQTASFADRLYETLHEDILGNPESTIIAPGHTSHAADRPQDEPMTASLGAVRDRLDLLSVDRTAFIDHVTEALPPRPANAERIVAINLGEETVDATTAFELELGPNNCAVAPADTA